MKIIEAKIKNLFGEYNFEKNQWAIDNFKMPIPNKARIHFCKSTLKKMKDAIALTNSKKFNDIGFLSTTRSDKEHCFIELFIDDRLIEVSQYPDFNRYFSSFDTKHFYILCDSLYTDSFQAKFLYGNGTGLEFSFQTVNFKI